MFWEFNLVIHILPVYYLQHSQSKTAYLRLKLTKNLNTLEQAQLLPPNAYFFSPC